SNEHETEFLLPERDDRSKRRPRWWFGGAASTAVACVVAPIDLVTTHMQTQNNKKGMWKTAQKVFKLRGFIGFYDGFSAAAFRQMTCTSLRFTIYEQGKYYDVNRNSFAVTVALASFAGAVSSILGIPMDLVNVRMQNDMKRTAAKKRNYKNFIDALIRIRREEGWTGLYSGGIAAVLKTAVGTIGQIAMYDQVKHAMSQHFQMTDTICLHFGSSLVSSLISVWIAHPFDVLKTLMMNAAPGKYPNILYAVKHMMRFGFWGPYRGVVPTLVRKPPATILLFLIYEQLRLNFGF
ncbi:Dic4, partial [Drosophila busckii]